MEDASGSGAPEAEKQASGKGNQVRTGKGMVIVPPPPPAATVKRELEVEEVPVDKRPRVTNGPDPFPVGKVASAASSESQSRHGS